MPQSVEYFVNDILSNRLPCNNPVNFNDPYWKIFQEFIYFSFVHYQLNALKTAKYKSNSLKNK